MLLYLNVTAIGASFTRVSTWEYVNDFEVIFGSV